MKTNDYLSSLTSLRGIAALLVIIFHFDIILFALAPIENQFFIRKGYLWVDFFFLLSGFIMLHVYGKYFSDGIQWKNYLKFMRARFARIYPLHLFTFLCTVILYLWYRNNFEVTPTDEMIFNLKAIPTNLLLIQSFDLHRYLTWNEPSWSISTEWFMYLIFPFMVIPFKKIIAWKKISVFIFIILGYLGVIYFLNPLSNAASPFPSDANKYLLNVTYDYGLIRCFFGFLFGMLLYELYAMKWAYSYLNKSFIFLLTSVAVIATMNYNEYFSDLVPVLLFAPIVLMGAYATGFSKKILDFKPFIFLGDISYSMYLVHMPVIFFLTFLFRKHPLLIANPSTSLAWLYCSIFVLLIIAISTITYDLIEMPLRKKLNPSLRRKKEITPAYTIEAEMQLKKELC